MFAGHHAAVFVVPPASTWSRLRSAATTLTRRRGVCIAASHSQQSSSSEPRDANLRLDCGTTSQMHRCQSGCRFRVSRRFRRCCTNGSFVTMGNERTTRLAQRGMRMQRFSFLVPVGLFRPVTPVGLIDQHGLLEGAPLSRLARPSPQRWTLVPRRPTSKECGSRKAEAQEGQHPRSDPSFSGAGFLEASWRMGTGDGSVRTGTRPPPSQSSFLPTFSEGSGSWISFFRQRTTGKISRAALRDYAFSSDVEACFARQEVPSLLSSSSTHLSPPSSLPASSDALITPATVLDTSRPTMSRTKRSQSLTRYSCCAGRDWEARKRILQWLCRYADNWIRSTD